ncbi:putative gibberellin regulated protein [Helianthus annuus]|nr:putative gibberellin regulated protein [Helianthus annuus]
MLHFMANIRAAEPYQGRNEPTDTSQTTSGYCGKACATRCMLSKRPHLCNRACGTCCGRCNCVPPGTSGNYEACACYAEMTTRGNKKKCP